MHVSQALHVRLHDCEVEPQVSKLVMVYETQTIHQLTNRPGIVPGQVINCMSQRSHNRVVRLKALHAAATAATSKYSMLHAGKILDRIWLSEV